MKEIKEVTIDSSAMGFAIESRQYTVKGDPGAVFSITVTNEDNHYYNFPENTVILNPEEETPPNPAFTATVTRLKPITIDETGVYSNSISFPTVGDDDRYILTIYPEMHYETKLSDSMGKGSYIFAKIDKLVNTVITFSHTSTEQDAGDESYGTYAANYLVKGQDVRVSSASSQTFSVSWAIALNSNDMKILRQPDQNDIYFTTTKSVRTAGNNTKTVEVTDISGLSVGMEVSALKIPSGNNNIGTTTITKITKGYYNAGKSTVAFPVYETPVIVDNTDPNNPSLSSDPGGTIVVAHASDWLPDRTLNFKGYGPVTSKIFNGTNFSISNFKVALNDIETTVNDTDATGAASLTVFDVASPVGINAGESTVTGIGINNATTTSVTGLSSNTVTVDTAFKPENGQALKFLGASRTGTITGDVTVSAYGSNNITLTLELDKILTVS